MNWLWAWRAFCLGCAAVFWLEAGSCLRQGQRRRMVLHLLLGGGLATAVLAAGLPPAADVPQARLPIPGVAAIRSPTPPAPATLPPPVIVIGEGATAVAPSLSASPVLTATPPRLRIPRLLLDEPVATIPLRDRAWDVSQLGGGVGRLESTGRQPGDDTAIVVAGHMTYPSLTTLEKGAFADLQYLTHGAEVIYEAGGHSYRYEVTSVRRVPPDAVDALYVADGSILLLVTCTDWDAARRVYAGRLIVQAQLATVRK